MKVNKNKFKVNMLSPISLNLKSRDEDGRWEYLDRLNNAINNNDGYNIAVSGTYGTGKSSIVKTYIDKFKMNNKVLKINIGSFLKTLPETKINKENKQETSEVSSDNIIVEKNNEFDNTYDNGVLSEQEELLMQKVEKTIVKQLIYTIKYSNAKLSGIPRLQNKWKIKYLIYSCSITYTLFCLWYFIIDKSLITKLVHEFFSLINKIPFLSNLSINPILPYLKVLFLINIVLIVIKFIYYLFTIVNKARTKIKIRDYELEIDNNSNLKFSFMDNIHEILYSFMNSPIEIVFFEDIDRYQKDVCIKIIEDLKELNSIINGCNGMNHKKFGRKKVVFVYSFKDSIFYKYTEKNKFYDYIVPIMPVSTRYNSQMHLINELNCVEFDYSKIDGELLNITSMYITDLRTIKNIANDFSLFAKILKIENDKIGINQLFALCVYKNYDINGYDKLLEYDNPIDEIIVNLGVVVEEEVEKDKKQIQSEIVKLKTSKSDKKTEFLSLNSGRNDLPQSIMIGFDDIEEVAYTDFMSDKFDVSKMVNEEINLRYSNGVVEISDKNEVNIFIDYIKKCDIKLADYRKNLDNLKHVFDSNNNDESLFNYSKKYINDVLNGKKQLNPKISNDLYKTLIFSLVYSGYIRTNYMDYITAPVDSEHFSLRDSKFIFGYNHQKYNFFERIDYPDRVIAYLGTNCYSSPYILNSDILDYIYDNSDNKKEIINQFNDISSERLEFLCQLKRRHNYIYDLLIKDLSYNFESIWESYCNKIDNKEIDESFNYNSIIVELVLLYDGAIAEISKQERLKSIISYYSNFDNVEFLDIEDNYIIPNSHVINNLKKLGIQFDDISKFLLEDTDLILDIIVENDLYKLNKKNILTILNHEKIINEKDNLNYEMMKKSKYSEYFKYAIINHMDMFSLNLYLEDDKGKFIINDNDLIKELLTKSEDELLINEILRREKFIIEGYSIPIKYINLAYENNHIDINWKFICIYSSNTKLVDKNLFKLAYDNVELFYNKDKKWVRLIPERFIKALLDILYKNKKYHITNVILKNYNTARLEKYNVYKDVTKKEEVDQKVEHDLVLYSKNNFQKIAKLTTRVILNKYSMNLIRNHEIEKIIDLIDIQMLIDLKNLFSDFQKIIILNKIIKRQKISDDIIKNVMLSIFNKNIVYSVLYRKEYMENIFSKIEKNIKMCNHENGMIKFKLK